MYIFRSTFMKKVWSLACHYYTMLRLYRVRHEIFQFCLWQWKTIIQIAFWEVSHLYTGLTQFINQELFSIISSFWSFIVSFCSLILLLPNKVSSEGLFKYGASISRYAQLLVSFLVKIFSTAPALPSLILLRTLVNLLD